MSKSLRNLLGTAILGGLIASLIAALPAPIEAQGKAAAPNVIRTVKLKNGKAFRFGRKRSDFNAPRLRLANYLRADLPAPPATTDYSGKSKTSLGNIYLNDTLGDCVIAGGWHIRGVVTAQAGKEVVATSAQITADYTAIGGYDPAAPLVPGPDGTPVNPTDNGCDMQTAMNYWTQNGFDRIGGKLVGWVAVDPTNIQQLKTAAWLFENLYFGVELPDAWVDPNADFPQANGFKWDVAGAPNPQNGHCIMGYGYSATGILIDTWGLTGTCTYAAIAQYMSANAGGECYVLVSSEMIAAGQKNAPNGFAWADLIRDFQTIGGTVTNPPPPPPSGTAPAITSSASASGTVGVAFSFQITATNTPTSYAAAGLPAGLSINTTTGLISGTPSTAGNSTISLTATNTAGAGKASLALSVAATPPTGPTTITIAGAPLAPGTYQLAPLGSDVLPPGSVKALQAILNNAPPPPNSNAEIQKLIDAWTKRAKK